MTKRTLLKDLLLLSLMKGNLEIFAESHELTEVNLAHLLLELIELAIVWDVLS